MQEKMMLCWRPRNWA